MSSEDFEKFSVYGFSIDYPSTCYVELSPKSRREVGDVVFHFPNKDKVYVTWEGLEKARKKFRTVDEQAEHSINQVTKSTSVRRVERLSRDSLTINSHKAVYNRLKLDEIPAGFLLRTKSTTHETHSVHLHCENSSRFFVIYSLLSSNPPENFQSIMMSIVNSFRCH